MIGQLFDFLAVVFDKIPGLNKIKGSRSILGLAGLAVVAGLQAYGVGNAAILHDVQLGLLGFAGLSLNAKGRE